MNSPSETTSNFSQGQPRPRRFSDTYIPVTLGATSTTLVGLMFLMQSTFTQYQVNSEARMTKLETKIELLIEAVQQLQGHEERDWKR
ncbi:hypothetical protein [Gloeothece verrucosa]|nr:hypothetical protein [Gloeothece verrucosa]